MKKQTYILTVNCGSSSIKVTLFEKNGKDLKEVTSNYIERVKNHKRSLKKYLKNLEKEGWDLEKITHVGHRVVHGGEKYSKKTNVTDKVIKDLKELSNLAPLHNPANVAGIIAAQKLIPNTKHYCVFDTAYYSTLPEKAYLYPIPYNLYKEHGIRRYGFHGTSHKYVTNEAITHLEKTIKSKKGKPLKLISCHLGNGASITATIDGKAVDTSMGFTPLEGLMMGTRSGDIDPAIIFHMEGRKTRKNPFKRSLTKIHHMLEKESGLKGVSELSQDMRDIRDAYFKTKGKKHIQAERALKLYCYRISKYIGAYTAAMNGVDGIIFTATVGQKADYIRKWVTEYLSYLHVDIDNAKNKRATDPKKITQIHSKKSIVKVLVIPTNEMLQIALEA